MSGEPAPQQLRDELAELCNKPPPHIINGSIQKTRAWLKAREKAAKVARDEKATGSEVISAINSLR